ncbi:uncharacterized protein [Polyergus mexicanus]|uniref:uncharacterized protein n=1 Tax=Polyergus mexicanus TaxID=615972 RepID=UPI0038B47307
MESTLKMQIATGGYIDRFWDNLVKAGKDKITQSYLKTRLALLETYWQRFVDGHYTLIKNEDASAAAYFKDDVYTRTEDNYVSAKTKITSTLRDASADVRQDSSATTASFMRQIQLPKISLPTFSGEQLDWESFRDLFRSLVGDVPDLAPVQKLQYLKASLTGEAAAIVTSVELSDKGYEMAWTELTSRYNNKRVLLTTHMRAFLNSAAIVKPSSTEIKRLISVALQARRSFASLQRPVDHWDDWFVHVTVEKLDSSSRLFWEASLQTSDEFPTFGQLQDFLHTRIRALDAASLKPMSAPAVATKAPDRKGKVNALTTSASGEQKSFKRCSLCQGTHAFNYCSRFKALSVPQRREHVKKQGACFNCLRLKHGVSSCPSGSRCLRCQGKHHSMLHNSDDSSHASTDAGESVTTAETQAKAKDAPSTTAIHSNVAALAAASRRQILLSTALATCFNDQGRSVVIRALLDSGSEATFLSERVAQALRLPRRRVHVPVAGIQGAPSGVVYHSVALTVGSPRDAGLQVRLPAALVLPRLTAMLPSRKVTRGDWPHLNGLALADPRFDQPAGVDAILGADAYGLLLREGLKTGPAGAPSAQATALGWVLMGQASNPVPATTDRGVSALHVATADVDLNRALQRFWTLEEVEATPILTPEDDYCESLFATTHARDTHGRYTLRLPRRQEPQLKLGNNRYEALNIFVRSESRLRRNPCTLRLYTDFMDEYKALGHMELVPATELYREDAYYLPHHAVFKTTGEENKIRVVFNASHRTDTGVSLNDTLLAGPKLQSELWLILTRWRLYRYAFTSDIVKMFRQIRVHPKDVDLQRILWRSDPTAEVQDFRLTTVVYGTSSAPYMALRTLKQLADDERSAYPLGANAIDSHSYVDDILAGGHTHVDAMEVQRQLVALLAAGGFQLSKWAANAPELCPDGEASDKLFHAREGVSTLGVLWSPSTDSFSLRVTPSVSSNSSTKRSVLSVVARFFDPLGWAAPVLVYGKIFVQDLWAHGLSWDQPLPTELQAKWTKFADSLPRLNKLHTPRSVNYYGNGTTVEVHGFSDASSRAYAAAVYLRTTGVNGNIQVSLLVAKTKVAPVKSVTIPRLELCGALLLARLLHRTIKGLGLDDAPVFAWTDAAVALSWIRAHPSRWPTFVSNRVAEVQGLVPPHRWRYVPTADNPADAATRGIDPDELMSLKLWWSGPPWLGREDYPEPTHPSLSGTGHVEELRATATHLARTMEENDVLCRFSTMQRLLRVTALCARFLSNARRAQDRLLGFITSAELNSARTRWVRVAQRQDYEEEITRLERGQPLLARSTLRPLRPFLDDEGLLRVGGRLQRALLPFNEKHPLILSKTNHLSLLFVREAHAMSLHGGPQLTRSLLLRRVWILRANSLTRSVIHACVRCTRFRAVAADQQMGQLPAERLEPIRPFRMSGVDYAGPVQMCASTGRGHRTVKGYICLFVCLTSKAVHLEPVTSLTSVSFLAAFRRFTSRRGHCQQLLSDNGTNFRGAAKELASMFRAASDFYKESVTSLANDGTTWSFIPPGAPHFGGLWEAGVKSVKYHLRRVIGDHTLSYEELATVLTQVEACLNSRPLYALSNDPSDLSTLTPGHLLIGEPLVNSAEKPAQDDHLCRLTNRWVLTSAMRDHFWKRWSTEYLHHLQQLRKWMKPASNLSIGDLVLIKSELQPPAKWALARVTALHPGPDGLVRVVSLKTANSTLKRPVAKLCPLPLEPTPIA